MHDVRTMTDVSTPTIATALLVPLEGFSKRVQTVLSMLTTVISLLILIIIGQGSEAAQSAGPKRCESLWRNYSTVIGSNRPRD